MQAQFTYAVRGQITCTNMFYVQQNLFSCLYLFLVLYKQQPASKGEYVLKKNKRKSFKDTAHELRKIDN